MKPVVPATPKSTTYLRDAFNSTSATHSVFTLLGAADFIGGLATGNIALITVGALCTLVNAVCISGEVKKALKARAPAAP